MPRPNVAPPLDLKSVFEKGLTWDDWLAKADDPGQAEKMRKVFAEVELSPDVRHFLAGLKRRVHILGIAEDWCGDVVQHTPVIAKLSQTTKMLELRLVARSPELIVRYLTNAAEAIPKFVFLTDKWVEVGNWGPRPETLKMLMARAKAAGGASAAYPKIKEFYEADQHQTVIRELRDLIAIAVTESI